MNSQHECDVIEPGTLFQGKYRIGSVLGRGDSAIVYEAGDQFLDEPIALKLIPRSGLGSSDELQRARREVKVMRRLHHPNLVEIRDAGMNEDFVFIAMEKLEGTTLRDILVALRRMSVPEALTIGIQVAEAMAAAHDLDAVHRDLKPENVMVLPGNIVKVLDFGRYLGDGDDSSADYDRRGTPLYMSPEQILQLSSDALADIYALGVILHEVLAGQHYLIGRSLRMDRWVGEDQLKHSPPLLSEQFDDIPESVARVIAKMMAKRPQQRYQSMREVATALREAQHDHETWAADAGVQPQARDLALAAGCALPQPPSPRFPFPSRFPLSSDPSDPDPDGDARPTGTSMSAAIPDPEGSAAMAGWGSGDRLGPPHSHPFDSPQPPDPRPPGRPTPLPVRSVRFSDGSVAGTEPELTSDPPLPLHHCGSSAGSGPSARPRLSAPPESIASSRPWPRPESIRPGQPSRLTVAFIFLAALLAAIPVGAGIVTIRRAARSRAAPQAPPASTAARPAARAASTADLSAAPRASASASRAIASAVAEPAHKSPSSATAHAAARLASPTGTRSHPSPTATGVMSTPPSDLAGLPVIRPKGATGSQPIAPPGSAAAGKELRLPASGLDSPAALLTSPLIPPKRSSAPQRKPKTGADP